MKKILVIFLLFILFLNGCSNSRTGLPDSIKQEYGITRILAGTGLTVDQAKSMLDDYDIPNNYPDVEKDSIVVFLAQNENTNTYYEIYVPRPIKYEIIVRETTLPEFDRIKEEIQKYNSQSNTNKVALCDDYCDVMFAIDFTYEHKGYTDFTATLSSPIIIKVGKLGDLDAESSSVTLGCYDNSNFVIFYYDIGNDQTNVISEFTI